MWGRKRKEGGRSLSDGQNEGGSYSEGITMSFWVSLRALTCPTPHVVDGGGKLNGCAYITHLEKKKKNMMMSDSYGRGVRGFTGTESYCVVSRHPFSASSVLYHSLHYCYPRSRFLPLLLLLSL